MMRKLSALHKSWCSLNMLQLNNLTSTSFQIDKFVTHCFFQSHFIACCSTLFSDLRVWSCQFSAHCICLSSVMRSLLMLLWWKHFQIFSHVFLIIFFMSDFLCCWWKLTSLVFRYKSSRRVYVSVSRIIINMILYILIIICKYLFYILISFLTDLFL